ncbi:hypothetical protein GQ44DRAFT_705907 [Phaeosphaeriaceae sp. PMI808]|nr:hypothetical protein GQ44DRAFT_705907 [Phaeosphaeriaceae sp. PMI808]
MKFATIASLFAATALAAPAVMGSTENITVIDGTFRRNSNEELIGMSFSFLTENNPDRIKCSTNTIAQPKLYECESPEYTFGLIAQPAYARFKVTIYHQTSPFAGLNGNVTMSCNGPLFTVCSLKGFPKTVLCSDLNTCGNLSDN